MHVYVLRPKQSISFLVILVNQNLQQLRIHVAMYVSLHSVCYIQGLYRIAVKLYMGSLYSVTQVTQSWRNWLRNLATAYPINHKNHVD